MPSNHPILCCPLLLPPSIFPSIRVFSNESVLHMRWPKYWSFRFSISPSNEYSRLISFRMDWLDLFAVQGALKSLLQHHSGIVHFSKVSCICVCVCVCVCACVCCHFSRLQLFATLWTIACQAPLPMGFSKQEYWSGLPGHPPGDLLDPGIKPTFLMTYALAGRFFTTSTTWEALMMPMYDLSQRKHSVLSFTTLCGYAQSLIHV